MKAGISGSLELTGNRGISLRLAYEEAYDAGKNTSVLKLTGLSFRSSGYYGVTYYLDGSISVNGAAVVAMNSGTGTHSVTVSALNTDAAVLGTPPPPWESGEILHGADGERTVTLSVNLRGYTASGGAGSGWTVTGEKQVALTAIPRASVPSLPVTSSDMGKTVTIFTNRASTAFTHTLSYAFAGTSGVIATGVGDSAAWAIPIALAWQLPNAVSGTCVITCDTYNGDTLLGSRTAELTLFLPAGEAPTISAFTATPVGEGAVGSWGVYVQGHSRVRLQTTASGNRGSRIVSYAVTGGLSGADVTSGLLTEAGNQSFTVTVTDSRGRKASKSVEIAVAAYAAPALRGVSLYRCGASGTADTGGASLYARAEGVFSPVDGHNDATLSVTLKTSAGAVVARETLTSKVGKICFPGKLSSAASYQAVLTLEDSLGKRGEFTALIPTSEVSFHVKEGGKGAAFGKYAEEDNLLDVNWDMRVRGRLFSANPMMYEAIPSGADLDDYINPGFYYSSSDSNTIANANGLHAFELMVTSIAPYNTNCYCTQWLKSYKENAFYVRTQLNWSRPLSWKAWTKIG